MAADRGEVTLVGLLGLSAAFDTIDHDILLYHLRVAVGIQGTAITWIETFATGRTQRISFASGHSSSSPMTCGVPQGSVLGPVLFLLYTTDVTTTARHHDIWVQSYADDIQLYLHSEAKMCRQHSKTSVLHWQYQQVDVVQPIEAELGQNRFYSARNTSATCKYKLQINQNILIFNQVICLGVLPSRWRDDFCCLHQMFYGLMFLPTSTTAIRSSCFDNRCCQDAGPCVHHQSCGLL